MGEVDDFIQRYRQVDYWWEHLDRAIFGACIQTPQHANVREVFGKVALINRCYRTNLEMAGGDAEWDLARAMVDERFDELIADCRPFVRFDDHSKPAVIEAHERFVHLAKKVTKRIENSFCAKYLSFHFRDLVPIFDGNAYNESRRLVGKSLPAGLYAGRINSPFAYHCEAVFRLIDALRAAGIVEPNLKCIDYVLYSEGAPKRKASPI